MRGEPFDTLESLCREILVKTEKMNPQTNQLIWNFDSLKFQAEQILDEIVTLNRQEIDFEDLGCVLSHTSIDEPDRKGKDRGKNRTEAYQLGREAAASGKGGNPWGGTPDNKRYDDYEDGKESYEKT